MITSMDLEKNQHHFYSPNQEIELFIKITLSKQSIPIIQYSIQYNRITLLLDSKVGIWLWKKKDLLYSNIEWAVTNKMIQSELHPLYGERDVYPDNYNEITLKFLDKTNPSLLDFNIVFRLYNEGFAFKYDIFKHPNAKKGELILYQDYSEFHFPADCFAYEEHGTEGNYSFVSLNKIKPECERPLTVVYPNKYTLLLTEANNYDYPRFLLCRSPKNSSIIVPDIHNQKMSQYISKIWLKKYKYQKEIYIKLPYSLPWRVCIIGIKPGDILERNYLIYNLSNPIAIQNTSWIKPGKVFREITLSTPNALKSIDFCIDHKITYLLFDAGWYGPEGHNKSDATTVKLDPKRTKVYPNHPGLDLPKVLQYAAEKGIGIFLYVNHRALRQQLDELLPLYQKWGIKGIKFGFVGVGPQDVNRWIHDAVKKCAEYKILVNIHDNYRPSGFSRSYPNLLTQEGIRGNENMPTARHNCTLPFTRFPMGSGDYTICYYDPRIKTTHAHQLAMAIIVYSPLQTILWYDKPDDYHGEPEIRLFEELFTVWDDIKVLDGKIGEYVIIARRKGDQWLVGCITNEDARSIKINFNFLNNNRYDSQIFEDFNETNFNSNKNSISVIHSERYNIKISAFEIKNTDELIFNLKSSGGFAIILKKI